MKRVLILQPVIEPLGGANAVAAWTVQALRPDYEITVLTRDEIDHAAMNRYFGTTLTPDNFTLIRPSLPIRLAFRLDPDPFSFQVGAYLLRMGKRLAPQYDACLWLDGEADLGERSIQYFHYPWLKRLYNQPHPSLDGVGWRRQLMYGVSGQVRPWRLVSQFSFARMRQNLSLANSEWTARVIKTTYGMDACVVYPPVANAFPDVPWEQRENGFVCIGRISTEKRYQDIVAILTRVRTHAPEIHLHIIGTPDFSSPSNRAYYTLVRDLARENTWVTLHENIPRHELESLVSQHRYGIHGMRDEHFGLAVAEMVTGGNIVFVPDDGGQVEIVNRDPRLVYGSIEDAAAKVLYVTQNANEQAALRAVLHTRRSLFTADHFMQQMREVVASLIQARAWHSQ